MTRGKPFFFFFERTDFFFKWSSMGFFKLWLRAILSVHLQNESNVIESSAGCKHEHHSHHVFENSSLVLALFFLLYERRTPDENDETT